MGGARWGHSESFSTQTEDTCVIRHVGETGTPAPLGRPLLHPRPPFAQLGGTARVERRPAPSALQAPTGPPLASSTMRALVCAQLADTDPTRALRPQPVTGRAAQGGTATSLGKRLISAWAAVRLGTLARQAPSHPQPTSAPRAASALAAPRVEPVVVAVRRGCMAPPLAS